MPSVVKMTAEEITEDITVPSYALDPDYSNDFVRVEVNIPGLLTTRTGQMYFKRPGFKPQFKREATNADIKFDCSDNVCYVHVSMYGKEKKTFRLTLDLPCVIRPEPHHTFLDVKDGTVVLYLCKKE